MSGDRWLLAKPDQQLSRFHLRNVRKWDRTKLPGLIAINKKANDESYCISMKWTTILGISYQAVERGKKLSRHWSADLPGLRKSVYTVQKQSAPLWLPQRRFCVEMYSVSDPTWRPSNHSFSISCVRRLNTRTLLQAATHRNCWHLQILGTVYSTSEYK